MNDRMAVMFNSFFYLISPFLMLGARQRPFPWTSKATPLYVATPFASVCRSGTKCSQILRLGFSSFSGTPVTLNTRVVRNSQRKWNDSKVGSYRGNSDKWFCHRAELQWAGLRVLYSLDWQHRGGGLVTEPLAPSMTARYTTPPRESQPTTHTKERCIQFCVSVSLQMKNQLDVKPVLGSGDCSERWPRFWGRALLTPPPEWAAMSSLDDPGPSEPDRPVDPAGTRQVCVLSWGGLQIEARASRPPLTHIIQAHVNKSALLYCT